MTKQSVVIERRINAPTGRVWQALTVISQLKQWLPFFPDFKAQAGFETEFMLGPDQDHQYKHVVKVLEVVDQQKLSYSWDYGGMSPGSSVCFELAADGEATQLKLTCYFTEIPADQPDFLSDARGGWTYTVDSLQKFVANN